MKLFLSVAFVLFTCNLYASALQEAIDKAKEGSILTLNEGIYEGNIHIDKSISIIGKSGDVVIKGSGEGSVIEISSSYVTLKNLHVTHSGERHDTLDAAIKMVDVKHCELDNLKIYDTLFGIDMQMTHNSKITNNYITSKEMPLGLRGDGMRLWYSNDNLIASNHLYKSRDTVIWYSHSNQILSNHSEYGRYSLHFMHAGKNFVDSNVYEFNSVGIFFMYSIDTIATNNTIKSSLGATGMGIGLKDVSNITLKNNTIIYNAQGLYIDRSPFEPDSTNLIENNKILYNSEAIHFHSLSENNIFKANSIKGNIEDVLNDSKGVKTANNTFTQNYFDTYEGFDRDNNNIGDTPHRVYQYADTLWLYNEDVKFFYGSPVISLLNFLAKLAPFSEPLFLFEDREPIIMEKG